MTEPEGLEGPECGGLKTHKWELSIEDGDMSVSTQTCGSRCIYRNPYASLGLSDWEDVVPKEHPYTVDLPMSELLQMAPVPVTVGVATNCPAYPVDENDILTGEPPSTGDRGHESGSHWIQHPFHCDCDWWSVITIIK